MATEYQLTGSTWRPRTLAKFLESHRVRMPTAVRGDPVVARVGNAVESRLFVEGCVRGVDLTLEGRAFHTSAIRVRIATLAGRADWMIAFDLLRALVREGQGTLTGPDGPVDAPQLTETEAAGLGMRRFADEATALASMVLDRGHPFAALPGPNYDLLVTRADLEGRDRDPARMALFLEELLAARAWRYERALPLPVMQAGDGTPFAFWPLGDALIDAVPYVAVARHEGDEPRVIEGRSLFAALGSGLESISAAEDRFFLEGGPSTSEFLTLFENAVPFPAWIASRHVPLS